MQTEMHDLKIVENQETHLVTGHCSCSWTSAEYGLRTTVRRAHALHTGKAKEIHVVSALYERLLPPRLLP